MEIKVEEGTSHVHGDLLGLLIQVDPPQDGQSP